MLGARDTFTARELVLCERAAFLAGINARPSLGDEWCGAACEAAKRYPLPTVTRPRVVVDPHSGLVRWYVDGQGQIVHEQIGPEFTLMADSWPTPERVALWADLLANPTETVEANP